MKLILFCIVLLCCNSAIWAAQDDRILQAESDVALEKKVEELNKNCSSTIKVEIDWPSFASAKWQSYNLASFCGSPVEGLNYLCGGTNSKAFIKSSVKQIKCSFGGKDKRALNINKGVVNYVVDFEAYNSDDYARAALIEKL